MNMHEIEYAGYMSSVIYDLEMPMSVISSECAKSKCAVSQRYPVSGRFRSWFMTSENGWNLECYVNNLCSGYLEMPEYLRYNSLAVITRCTQIMSLKNIIYNIWTTLSNM